MTTTIFRRAFISPALFVAVWCVVAILGVAAWGVILSAVYRLFVAYRTFPIVGFSVDFFLLVLLTIAMTGWIVELRRGRR